MEHQQMEDNQMNIRQIMEILPHRYPFLLVDRIVKLEPGVKAAGVKNVSANEPYFQGHFPGFPVMPGVLVIEALAQVGAAAVLSMPGYAGKLVLFAGIDKARFRRQVVPGDILHLEVELLRLRSKLGKGRGVALVDGEIAAEIELLFAITDRDNG